MDCPQCGTTNSETSTRCANCGHELRQAPAETQEQHIPSPTGSPEPLSSKVASHMVWSILAAIFCFLPTGLIAVWYSSKVGKKLAEGDADEAKRMANRARNWCIVSCIGLLIWLPIVILLPNNAAIRQEGYDSKAKAFLKNAAVAEKIYRKRNNRYTDSVEALKKTGLWLEDRVEYRFSVSPDGSAYSVKAWSPHGTLRIFIITSINAEVADTGRTASP